MAGLLSSTGTWTAILTPTTGQSKTDQNNPAVLRINPLDLETPPDEVRQMIQLISDNYSVNFWTAATLLGAWLTSYTNKGAPRTLGQAV